MRRVAWVVLLAAVAAGSGCTNVKMVQRDGCWVRQTEDKPFGGVREELGPCMSPEIPWVTGDRLTRLMQECAVRADRRWNSRALAAWSRGEPIPDRADRDDVLRECLDESARAVVGESEAVRQENEALRRQLAALGVEHDALRARDDQERKELVATSNRLVDHLGEAAKKAQQPGAATATARSEQSSSTTQAPPQPATVAVVQAPAVAPVVAVQAPAAAPVVAVCPAQPPSSGRAATRQARSPAESRRAPAAKDRPDCAPATTPVIAPATEPVTPAAAAPAAAAPPPAPSAAPSAPGPSAPAPSQ
jgi:hypothetical protein